jgi:hypothetical protein
MANNIALGVGLGIGIPTLLLTLLGVYFAYHQHMRKARQKQYSKNPSNTAGGDPSKRGLRYEIQHLRRK